MKLMAMMMLCAGLYAQSKVNLDVANFGKVDHSNSTSTLPHRAATGSPVGRDACATVGESYFKKDAPQSLFYCTATGSAGVAVWTPVINSGGSSTLNSLPVYDLNGALAPNAYGVKVDSSGLTAGDGTQSSGFVYPELAANGSHYFATYGGDSRTNTVCIFWPDVAPSQGQLFQMTNLTATTRDGKTCYKTTLVDPVKAVTAGLGQGTYSMVIDANGNPSWGAGLSQLSWSTSSLASGTESSSYTQALAAQAGTSPYTFTCPTSCGLPSGLSISGANITGTPAGGTAAGSPYSVLLRVTDSVGTTADRTFSLVITAAGTVAVPTFDKGTGAYTNDVVVTLSDTTSGATICFRTDGTAPAAATPGTCSAGSTTYSSPFTIGATGAVLKALGTKAAMTNSAQMAAQTYTLNVAAPTSVPGLPTTLTSCSGCLTFATTTTSGVLHYTTDGSTATCASPTYSVALTAASTTTYSWIACKANYNTSAAVSGTLTISAGGGTFTEDFSGSGDLDHTYWTEGPIHILRNSGTGNSGTVWNIGTALLTGVTFAPTGQWAQVTVSASANASNKVCILADGSGHAYCYASNGALVKDGAYLATCGFSVGDAIKVSGVITGSSVALTGYRNGSAVCTYTDGSGYTTGVPWIAVGGSGTLAADGLQNFTAGSN